MIDTLSLLLTHGLMLLAGWRLLTAPALDREGDDGVRRSWRTPR